MSRQIQEPVSKFQFLLTPFQQFARSESFGGILLIVAALIAFVISNSPFSAAYFDYKQLMFGFEFGGWSLKKPLFLWINDGLMAVFFLMVGLEIKRELLVGELSRPRDAALSVFAALGGMVVPALIYTLFNFNTPAISGWGIPMATDIAFALGVMALLGSRVPLALKVFLTALAIVDDLGAVLVIAVFYTESLQFHYLLYSFLFLFGAWIYGKSGGRSLFVFLVLGAIAWYCMLKSGVHATVAGVLLAFTIPIKHAIASHDLENHLREVIRDDSFEEAEVKIETLESILEHAQSLLHRLEHALQPIVAYFIMPVFAFFNAGVRLSAESASWSPVVFGCFLGLVLGKPLGVFAFAWISSRLGIASLPRGIHWMHIFSAGMLAGIGFTMSFFIAALAFGEGLMLDQAKIGILSASVFAALVGLFALFLSTRSAR
ncbi:MAG: Na+/H+ antiporter NhaA [Candidatus Omnitrophota bacterium]|jgi:NhaA family Na+:H+ antiporter|nr:MAG: Na+/H+ antiporter NhaA [Candidatus Omnitrophota bacterium]